MVLTFAATIVGLGAVGLVGQFAWLWRGSRPDAARTRPPRVSTLVRAVQPPSAPEPTIEHTSRSACTCTGCPGGCHWPPRRSREWMGIMDEQPSQYNGWRPWARCWRAALLWMGALAALVLAGWIAVFASLDAMGG